MTALRAASMMGLSCLFAVVVGCGGSQKEAMAPTAETLEALRSGSGGPEAAAPVASSEPPKTSAVSSKDDGSDIIPPFSAAGKDATKKSGPAKVGQKKGGAKPKKKG